jgi:O-6-methylguanine DNA methyltransferase
MSLVIDSRETVWQLSFGHVTPQEALASVSDALALADDELADSEQVDAATERCALVHRLQAYAEGVEDDFLDVEIDCSNLTPFQTRVVEICRRIPFGSSLTYGDVAARAGHSRAARAVGNCMRANHVPLIVPCHRVVGAGGARRGDSPGEGIRLKLRLLEMESARQPRRSRKRVASERHSAASRGLSARRNERREMKKSFADY